MLSTAVGLVVGPSFQSQEWVGQLAESWNITFSLGAQGLEWGETPFWIDPIALLGLALVALNYFVPIASRKVRCTSRCGTSWRLLCGHF